MYDLTFVIPFFNEEQYLPATLSSLRAQELNKYRAEVLLVDGNSTDRSRLLSEEFAAANSDDSIAFVVISNPKRKTPVGFNMGIKAARSPIIGFGGAHALYPPSLFTTAINLLTQNDADAVGGGVDRFVSLNVGVVTNAILFLYKSPVGSGVAAYHRRKTPGLVDTVFGGFYRKEVFDKIGSFNETMNRGQDIELNARVKDSNMKILFHPDLSITYIMKSDLKTFFSRGFKTGICLPVTWITNPKAFHIRHLIPMLFVLYFIIIGTLIAYGEATIITLIPLYLYIVLQFMSAAFCMRNNSVLTGLLTFPLFLCYHLVYGLGTITGIFKYVIGMMGFEKSK
jgi:glycosyltransferase involved in cell wall biosynthesis